MRHIRLITIAFLAIAPSIASAQALTTTVPELPIVVTAPQPLPSVVAAPAPVTPAPTVIIPNVSPPPPVTQNTVTTTGPVASTTTISVGTLAGQVLTWAITGFGSILATVFAAWGVRLFKIAGVQITDAARDRLQQIILNGLNVGAAKASTDLAGRGQIEIKDAALEHAVAYVQNHGADTIKQLGLDPNSGAAVEAIRAHIETAIADPTVATPAAVNATAVAKPATAA